MHLFTDLKLDERVTKALEEIGFLEMTEVQVKSIPPAMEGKDLIVQAMTGSGKTAAFGVPIVERTTRGKGIQAAIIGPTRELVNQVSTEFEKFSKHKQLTVATIFGGVSMEPQVAKLKHAEIVVGTPGRMLDHLRRGTFRLDRISILVLDEADRMLDMGFIDDIRTLMAQTPKEKQTMLFSATIPPEIVSLARRFMNNPVTITGQRHVSRHLLTNYYYDVRQEHKVPLLDYLIRKEHPTLAMVFCATRHITDFVANELHRRGIEAQAIHGGLSQQSRMAVLKGFHQGALHVLVATDVAARGLDIQNVSHVFNYDIPKSAEDYTHRIGRTARFGKEGKALSLLSQHDHEAFRKIVRDIDIVKLEVPDDFHPQPVFFRKEHTIQRRTFSRRGPPRHGSYRGRR